ncbi:hypothetical protein T05_13614 [Trichinella murrelli]|uniref:Uncharacterized protein n=1 Tax=Trichinella murrelli TaxID=144512 RepID=A0A0V0U600_9BILA|nr:hypothetical protein T05_13614 [Trichinella murrelli]
MASAAYAKGNLRRSVRVAVLMGSFECFFIAALADEQAFWFGQLVARFYRNSKAFMRIWNSVKQEYRKKPFMLRSSFILLKMRRFSFCLMSQLSAASNDDLSSFTIFHLRFVPLTKLPKDRF